MLSRFKGERFLFLLHPRGVQRGLKVVKRNGFKILCPDNSVLRPPEGQSKQQSSHEQIDAALDSLEKPEAIYWLIDHPVLNTMIDYAPIIRSHICAPWL